ncbi:MAG: nucleotidyltransferase domain-containing protein [Acholeplasmataceae bacterium]
MDFPPLIIRHDIELSVSKTNFSFLKHLFCWYEENEFSYYLYKRIAYQIQVPTNDKERRYLCFNQAYQYLLKHAQESDKQIIIKTFFVMLFDHNVSIEGIENLFDKFGKKIHSFEDLCDYQAYLSLYLPFSKQDNMIISLMFFNVCLLKNGYRTIKITTTKLADYLKLYDSYRSGVHYTYYNFFIDLYNSLPFQDKNFYSKLCALSPDEIADTLAKDQDYLKEHYHCISMSLFGSFFDGDYRFDSDIDLFVTIEQGLTYLQKETLVQEFKNHYQNVFHRYIDLKEEFIAENIKRKLIY